MGTNQTETPILLTSFCRPNMTREAILRTLNSGYEGLLYVSHDGPIRGFFDVEHRATRDIITKLKNEYPQIQVIYRDSNRGITRHIIDSMTKVLENHDSLIFLEEDMVISKCGLEFLAGVSKTSQPEHRVAFTRRRHTQSPNLMRSTRFPEQWGISINKPMFELFRSNFESANVEWKIVWGIMKGFEVSLLQRFSSALYWHRLMKSQISGPHGWDALLQYTCWKSGRLSLVSHDCFVTDLGGIGEPGGYSKRAPNRTEQSVAHLFLGEKYNTQICQLCEIEDFQNRNITLRETLRSIFRIRTRLSNSVRFLMVKNLNNQGILRKLLR